MMTLISKLEIFIAICLLCIVFGYGQLSDTDSDCNGNNKYLCETNTCNACIECNPIYLTKANCDECTCQMYWWTILIVKFLFINLFLSVADIPNMLIYLNADCYFRHNLCY